MANESEGEHSLSRDPKYAPRYLLGVEYEKESYLVVG